jgi:uncharacterized membrane protein
MQGAAARFNQSKQYWKGLVIATFLLTLFAWLLNTPPGLFGKADAIGYAVCHQIDLRSFHIGDRQLPLCARCSGMYLGAMVGLIYQWVIGRRRTGMPPWQIIVPTSIFVLLFAVDGLNSFFSLFSNGTGLYQPNNNLRLLTGTGMGLAIAVALVPAFNATVWKMIDPRPAFIKFRSFLYMVFIALGLNALILIENNIILYPLSLISAAGVLILLTLVYSMVLVMIFKAENRFNQFSQLTYAILGGCTIALIQIGLLDFIRYLFTGSWDGFHL